MEESAVATTNPVKYSANQSLTDLFAIDGTTIATANVTEYSAYQTFTERQLFSAYIFITMIVGYLGNSTVVYLVWSVKKLRTVTNVFVVNLAVADSTTCGGAILSAVVVLSYELIIPVWLCQCIAFGLITVIGCSVNTLALIAVNRLVAVTDTARIRYRKIYTRWKIAAMIAMAWAIPIFVALIPVFSDYAELGYDPRFSTCTWLSAPVDGLIYSFFVTLVFYPIQLTIVIASYIRIFLFVRSSTKAVMLKGNPESGTPSSLQKQLSKRQLAVTKNLFLVVCVFLVCLFPYFFVLALDSLAFEALPFTAVLLLTNSCLNPIIYGTKHPDFRVEFSRLFSNFFGKCRSKRAKPLEERSRSVPSSSDKVATTDTKDTQV
ncbi:alpha-1D adrenergic receptor-like [Acanthaster planci]|uniref:Alpha-1D adrenergic receptor-like n=1 Tax=Acanthaster planci TaxID=133434 RepID=A0A8B7YU67_ACAPL|nr:alpha-1D adrenergic receptor-like [Acanthaster planci]